jgi:class 3 adenylate cyclase
MRAEGARYIAEHVEGARYVELPGADHFPFVGDVESIVREVEDLVANAGGTREPDRVLATILCSEVVAPNVGAAAANDARLRELLAHHDDIAGRELARLRGRRVKSVGTGFVATFDGPARAIRCACAIREAARRAGIELRAGLHAGECELLPDDIGGVAVEICSNVAANAAPGEVLVTHTVKDLIAGSHLRFADRGTRKLHGTTDEWRLFAAEV